MMLFRTRGGITPAEAEASSAFREIASLSALRSKTNALKTGRFVPLWVDSPGGTEDDGIFAFARVGKDSNDAVLVVFNASDRPATTGAGGLGMQLPADLNGGGARLQPIFATGGNAADLPTVPAQGRLLLKIPPQSAAIYQISSSEPPKSDR